MAKISNHSRNRPATSSQVHRPTLRPARTQRTAKTISGRFVANTSEGARVVHGTNWRRVLETNK